MRAERNPNRSARPDIDRDPEVIDVCRDAIDLGGECNRSPSHMNQVAMIQRKRGALLSLSVSMWQADQGEDENEPLPSSM